MTNLGEQQLDEVKHAATTALICIYLLLVGLAGFLHKVPTVLGECACAIVHVLLFLPFSPTDFLPLILPQKGTLQRQVSSSGKNHRAYKTSYIPHHVFCRGILWLAN